MCLPAVEDHFGVDLSAAPQRDGLPVLDLKGGHNALKPGHFRLDIGQKREARTIAGVIIALLFGGVVVALMDAQMAGILQRYYADFSFMFLAASVLLAFIVNENLRPGSTAQVLLMKGLLTLVCISVLYVALLCFVPETGWFSDIYPWSYQDIIETVLFWT